MNTENKFLKTVFFIGVIILYPLYSVSQVTTEKSLIRSNDENWRPVKLKEDGTNVMNGVSFYKRTGHCDSEDLLFIKLINVNNYPVKVEWQLSPDAPKTSVTVPASRQIEGDCSSGNDENLSKLSIHKLKNKEEKKKIFEYMRSVLTVSEIKK